MGPISKSGYQEFDDWLGLLGRTRELLDEVAGARALPDGGADYLAERTLPHVEGIQAGFLGWLRSEMADPAELRYLLSLVAALRVGTPESEAERRAADLERDRDRRLADSGRRPPAISQAVPWNLAALEHARVVLALLPRLPDEAVRFPGPRRTYADIPAPRGPAELADRLTELERELWLTATGHDRSPRTPSFRRTYGFFDAADRLGWRAFRGAV
jgi:hypothetical protein